MIVTVLASIMASGGIAAYFERRRLVKLLNAKVKASDAVRENVEGVLNTIRADEALLTTHVYQVITRVRTELRKVL